MSTLSLPVDRPAWHAPLVEFLPLVRSVAGDAFRALRPAEREDAVCDVVADSTAEFARLAAKGRAHFWLIAPVARYAVRRRAAGRRVGTATNKLDALSPVPRAEAHVASLDALEAAAPDAWRAAVADSRRTDPAEAAAFRSTSSPGWVRCRTGTGGSPRRSSAATRRASWPRRSASARAGCRRSGPSCGRRGRRSRVRPSRARRRPDSHESMYDMYERRRCEIDWLFWLFVIGGVWWLLSSVHKSGKREGSRKAYGVGLRRGRGRR